MSLLFTPLTRTASDSMNRARGAMPGASPDADGTETSDYGSGDDEDSLTQSMKQLRMEVRGSSPSLSVTDLMSNTKSKVDMFFSQRTTSQVMYKSEDLRQDQLVVQMITLIDRLWKSVNLDLRLTPYRVLATGPDDGLVEFIEHTSTLTDVLKDYNQDIRSYFREHSPDPKAEFGIDAEVMETFIRSSAGYCVITYILGIGDRHLENLMLKPTGHLLHIDFGFIFGKDPKPMPAPMRLTKEMVQCMGGKDSVGFAAFQRYCCQGYNILRYKAPLILSLLNLLKDSGIKDFCVTQNANQVIEQVKEKLRLDLSVEDEASAEEYLKAKLEDSVSAIMPVLMDMVHGAAVATR